MEHPSPAKTQQSYRDSCNINTIVAKYKAGETPLGVTKAPIYGDFSNLPNFREMQQQVAEANESFMKIDPKIRERFNHDPAKLIDFVSDAKNKFEAISLGLIPEPVKPVLKAGDPLPTTPPAAKPPEVKTA